MLAWTEQFDKRWQVGWLSRPQLSIFAWFQQLNALPKGNHFTECAECFFLCVTGSSAFMWYQPGCFYLALTWVLLYGTSIRAFMWHQHGYFLWSIGTCFLQGIGTGAFLCDTRIYEPKRQRPLSRKRKWNIIIKDMSVCMDICHFTWSVVISVKPEVWRSFLTSSSGLLISQVPSTIRNQYFFMSLSSSIRITQPHQNSLLSCTLHLVPHTQFLS